MKTTHAISIYGGIHGLAKALGITIQAIYQWGENVPPLRAYQIREKRPDVFGPASDEKASA